MNETFVVVKFDLEGSHYWPDAPVEYTILRIQHGHVFHFEVHIPENASRQIEFLEARRELRQALIDRYGYEPCLFGARSCEDLARWLIDFVEAFYHCGAIVRVMEDMFVGAEVRKL